MEYGTAQYPVFVHKRHHLTDGYWPFASRGLGLLAWFQGMLIVMAHMPDGEPRLSECGGKLEFVS